MIKTIEQLNDAINSTLAWIKVHKPEYYEQKFMQLIPERCRLNTIKMACQENPAVAAYGESQKGKSYLIGNLLQNGGKAFKVRNTDGDEIDFVKNINPIGRGREATGVVTRFSAFGAGNEDRYFKEHPVLMKLFSVSDIVTILCDGYFNDISDYETYQSDQMQELSDKIYNEFKDRSAISESPLIEDDIFNIKTYFIKHIKARTQNLWTSQYFDKLALVIRNIPKSEWINVFSVLWHRNEHLTDIFTRLVNVVERMGYAREVYLDMDAVFHNGYNKDTIMSVECLAELDKGTDTSSTNVFIKNADGSFRRISGFSKSELSAVCAETVFKVEKDYTSSEIHYDLEMIPEETKKKLPAVPLKNTLMAYTDLLDFPGARNRLSVRAEHLKQQFVDNINRNAESGEGSSNLVQILLRGKVAYLFNKYCDDRIINILLFCQDHENVNVTSMYDTIDTWVKNYVGDTDESRRQTMRNTGGIPPLFLIATKFNVDMVVSDYSSENSRSALDQRWKGRFENLYTQSLNAANVDWFKNWSGFKESFKNCYLLRDFRYSNVSGEGNNLYEGFTKDHPREEFLKLPEDFYRSLRESFVNSPYVQTFFSDPYLAWDVAATIRNDGSAYIIEKLTSIAERMDVTREEQFKNNIAAIKEKVIQIIGEFHEPEDNADSLQRNIEKAQRISGDLDLVCNQDNYYFGHLIKTLQSNFKTVYNIVHKTIQNPALIQEVTSFSNYEIIMKRCGDRIRECKSVDEVLYAIKTNYGYHTEDEARQKLAKYGVNPEDLVNMQYRKKLNSGIIAANVYNCWKDRMLSSGLLNNLTEGNNVDGIVISFLLEELVRMSVRTNLDEIMADSIAKYVDILDIHTANEELVADILLNIINNFVADFGFSLLDEATIDNCREISRENEVDLLYNFDEEKPEVPMTAEELSVFFNEITRNPPALTPSFEDNYFKWTKYMFIAFISENWQYGVFDKKANHELTLILETLN